MFLEILEKPEEYILFLETSLNSGLNSMYNNNNRLLLYIET